MSAGKKISIAFFMAASLTLFLIACQKRPDYSNSFLLPYDLKVVVAGFSQPTSTDELISGRMPDKQGLIPEDILTTFDANLRQTLENNTKRLYTYIPAMTHPDFKHYRDAESPMALPAWVKYAQNSDSDLLLVPQIINWRQRAGSEAGVTHAAHVRAEFYIIDLRSGRIIRQSIYDVEQVGLVDNLLTVGDFFKRKGRWVTAEQLGEEAIGKAVKELGL